MKEMGPKDAGDWLKLADREPEAQAVAHKLSDMLTISQATLLPSNTAYVVSE